MKKSMVNWLSNLSILKETISNWQNDLIYWSIYSQRSAMEKVGHTTLMTMFSVKKKRNMITHVYLAHSVKKILNWKTDISHLPFPPKVTAYFSLVWNKVLIPIYVALGQVCTILVMCRRPKHNELCASLGQWNMQGY